MSLQSYHSKRDFTKTNEPKGKKSKDSKHELIFVVQKHHARQLHYDFRLEMAGTLKSWAVPKGPSQDPHNKRLAVEVEDHPIEYAHFSGIIPKGHYGAGKVEIWDEGTWYCEENPLASWKRGKISFELKGNKLHGKWALVRMARKNGEKKNQWLLIKEKDHDTEAQLKLEWLPPQLPSLVSTIPNNTDWIYEIKLDGYRIQCLIENEQIRFFSRRGHDWSEYFENLKKEVKKLGLNRALLDGEILFINSDGRSDFQKLQNIIHNNLGDKIEYYIFDILYLENKDLTKKPLLERKNILQKLLSGNPSKYLHYTSHIENDGALFYQEACKNKLEGVVAKRKDAIYESGHTKTWLKAKCIKRQEFVILGFMINSENKFKSLIVGYYDEKHKLHYAGRVGTGFTEETLKNLSKLCIKHQTHQAPLSPIPKVLNKNARWVKPIFVAEVDFRGWTKDLILRQPAFKGLREDKNPEEITRESPSPSLAKIKISHPEKMVYSQAKITKQEIVSFYEKIAPWIRPYILNRPLSVVRCPSGIDKCFFQKHLENISPKFIKAPTFSREKKQYESILIDDTNGLIELIQLNVIELHPWNAQFPDVLYPDQIIFDLDPGPGVNWKTLVESAFFIHHALENLGLKNYVKTTGGKGLHIHCPIIPNQSWETVRDFTKYFAKQCALSLPKRYTATASKSARQGKIFIDYLRNHWGSTAVSPYSLRTTSMASVATPLSWDELKKIKSSDFYTIKNIFKRLSSLKEDPWEDYWKIQQKLPTS